MIYTIGHSDLTVDKFISDLQKNDIKIVADVRKLTGSNAFPQFNEDRLAVSLRHVGIRYVAIPELSGRRPLQHMDPKVNGWWENQSFHNYADYATKPGFQVGLRRLISLGSNTNVAIMCAEAVPWRCHRRIIADHLIGQGLKVQDISSSGSAEEHELPAGAVVKNGTVTYPASGGSNTAVDGQEQVK